MPHRIEIALRPELTDPEGEGIRRKALDYFGIEIDAVRTVHGVVIDADLSPEQVERVRRELFTNPVTQISALSPLPVPFDGCIWVGFRPGVRDNPGATAVEAVRDILGREFGPEEDIYTSRRYCLTGPGITRTAMETVARELLANEIIQQWRVYVPEEWDPARGVGSVVPRVKLDRAPTVTTLSAADDETLRRISDARNLALNPRDIPVIRAYFNDPEVRARRAEFGLSDPTDVELEYISQARSDHCNHNTFRGKFHYRESSDGPATVWDNLFETCIEAPTLALQKEKDWVVSVLWDNAGVGRFDADHFYAITGETHNSPSNMEAYGGAITGIVGVYRDPMGTGKGARLVMGAYGFCVGPRDYAGPLRPRLHPRRLLDGVIEGVRDGGNKSGVPTPLGQLTFHPGYLGKCLVFVTAVGLMPARLHGRPSVEKETSPGDLAIMCGGRVGKDGIHGVTASSEVFSESTPAGHVQIGDPYTQKKMHDFLLEARDAGLVAFITDNGGGGLSSSVGESARFSDGCEIELDKAPLKYPGLDPWEVWVSESQERMTVAVRPEDMDRFMALSRKHAVESTAIGRYTDSGMLHIVWEGRTCAYVDMDLLRSGFPQWEFEAIWRSPEERGLTEPVLGPPADCDRLLLDMLARPNLCSREWIARQYDHEVQGGSVVKPLSGAARDMPSDAAVIRPRLDSERGLAVAQALLPQYSAIDAHAMTACVMDEAVRRLVAVGVDPDRIGGVDNFCWPNIQYDPVSNPDGRFKAAQLVRSCMALRDICLAYGIPLLSGKDSMYVDGHLPGRYGETHKVSALETLQFSTVGVVDDIAICQTADLKAPGDLVYGLGWTRDELGGSEYYEHLGYVGRNVPQVRPEPFLDLYRRLHRWMRDGRPASVHGVYRGGLGVHLALIAMGGRLGLSADLALAPVESPLRFDRLLFSESAGRFLATVAPGDAADFEAAMDGLPWARIGEVLDSPELILRHDEEIRVRLSLDRVIAAWKRPFGDLI
jgi:phosphoribosylformylglycinamidine synthase subunit PurSL